jgi:hypothetical protein
MANVWSSGLAFNETQARQQPSVREEVSSRAGWSTRLPSVWSAIVF